MKEEQPVTSWGFDLPEPMVKEGFRVAEPLRGGRSMVFRVFSQETFAEILVQNRKLKIVVYPRSKMDQIDIAKLTESILTGLTGQT